MEIRKIELVSTCDVGVLICGETGTGKELVARAIHYLSPRSKASFLPVNCGAIPQELAETEFFGHSQGAFTGAGSARPGLVEEADRGTRFAALADLPTQFLHQMFDNGEKLQRVEGIGAGCGIGKIPLLIRATQDTRRWLIGRVGLEDQR